MHKFVGENKRLLIVFGLLALFEVGVSWAARLVHRSHHFPISLSPPGRAEGTLLVLLPDEYTLYLKLDRDGPTEGFANKVLNSNTYHLPITWSLRPPGKAPILEQTTDQPKGAGLGENVTIALYHGRLEPGRYVFSAEALKEFPELQPHHPRLVLTTNPKREATWQRAAFNTVELVGIVLLPVLLILVVILFSRLVPFMMSGARKGN